MIVVRRKWCNGTLSERNIIYDNLIMNKKIKSCKTLIVSSSTFAIFITARALGASLEHVSELHSSLFSCEYI